MSVVDRSMIRAPGLYLSNVTCFISLLYMTNSNNIKTLCIPHGKERTNVLRKDEENVLINTKRTMQHTILRNLIFLLYRR